MLTSLVPMTTMCFVYIGHRLVVGFSPRSFFSYPLQRRILSSKENNFPSNLRRTERTLSSLIQSRLQTNTVQHLSFEKSNDNGDFGSNNNGRRDLEQVLRVAEEAARKAGDIMRRTAGNIDILNFKANTKDLVTESDIACQEIIHQTIRNYFPNDQFLGEESVDSGSDASASAIQKALRDLQQQQQQKQRHEHIANDGDASPSSDEDDSSPLLWIVDPIDGTTNFQSGLPLFCASIGVLSSNAEVVVGVVYNPIFDEMTSAIRGKGCFVNGKKLNVNIARESSAGGFGDFGDDDELSSAQQQQCECIRLNQALINIGFPVSTYGTLMASSKAIQALSTKVKGLRMIASASQVMAWVAQKKLNAYVSWDLNAWDICAGVLLVEEAGGFVSDFDGKRGTIESRDLIISSQGSRICIGEAGYQSEGFHSELLSILKENDCLNY